MSASDVKAPISSSDTIAALDVTVNALTMLGQDESGQLGNSLTILGYASSVVDGISTAISTGDIAQGIYSAASDIVSAFLGGAAGVAVTALIGGGTLGGAGPGAIGIGWASGNMVFNSLSFDLEAYGNYVFRGK